MDMIALILSIVGSLNWGLVALFKFDLVAVAGVWCATFLFRRDAVTD